MLHAWPFFILSVSLTLEVQDYTQITTSLTFTSADLKDCVQFNLVDDFAQENVESFTVNITSGGGSAASTINIFEGILVHTLL